MDNSKSRGQKPAQELYVPPKQRKQQQDSEQEKKAKKADVSESTDKTAPAPDVGSSQDQGQQDVEKEKGEKVKSEPPKDSSKARKPPVRPRGVYIPPRQKEQKYPELEETSDFQPEKSQEEVAPLNESASLKHYDTIKTGDVLLGPTQTLSIFAEKIGTTASSARHSQWQHETLDRIFHPQIVIEKNDDTRTVQTVVVSTFDLKEGQKLEDKRYLDYEVVCKYFVPMEGRSHESEHREKGQPDFTVELAKDSNRLSTQAKGETPGWACTFMFLVINATFTHGRKLRVFDGVRVSEESISKLRGAIDANEEERKKYIVEKYEQSTLVFADPFQMEITLLVPIIVTAAAAQETEEGEVEEETEEGEGEEGEGEEGEGEEEETEEGEAGEGEVDEGEAEETSRRDK